MFLKIGLWLIMMLLGSIHSQESLITPLLDSKHTRFIENHSYESRKLNPKRDLLHVHIQSATLSGNSTDLQYFYVDVYVGSHKQK